MQQALKKNWRQRSWVIPASILLHVLVVGAFFMQWPERTAEPVEPESVSVELVPPEEEKPKAEEPPPPAPPKADEAKPVQPPPPPPEKAEDKPQSTPVMQQTLPSIAVRPDPPQMDAEDNPAKSEDVAKAEQPQPEEKPAEDASQAAKPPAANGLEPTAQEGEIAAVKSEDVVKSEDPPVTVKPEETKPEPEKEKPAQTKASDKLTKAKTLLANDALANPGLRQMLGDLPPKRRIVQMCSIEALAQIRKLRADMAPMDGLVPFSDKGGFISRNVLDASGGAFNIGRTWFDFNFHCEVDLETYAVTNFRYEMGGQVPNADAVKRRLPTP